jgi:hypothetical protein
MGGRDPFGFVRLGRIYRRLGTGLVFNGTFDGMMTGWSLGPVTLNGFLGVIAHETDDMDQSRPQPDISVRYFYSLNAEVNLGPVTPYFFFVIQRDGNPDVPTVPLQKFDWNSEYWGVGARGNILVPQLTFTGELVIETGRRFASLVTTTRESIHGWAFIGEAAYKLDHPISPQATFTYMFATGDSDRIFVPNTLLGNAAGTSDRTFTAFGYVPTGFLFNPILANLHIRRLAFAAQPISPEGFGARQLDVGLEFFHYEKAKRGGGISDPFMNLNHTNVGWEIDAYAYLTAFSDVTVMLRCGYFSPEAEPQLQSGREFFLMSLVLSF